MRYLRDCSEDEMISVFLKAELSSPRFGQAIRMHLQLDSAPHRMVTTPNLESAAENAYRRRLIGACRGFGRNEELFRMFPATVQWRWADLNCAELSQVRYIDDDYWVELSGGSRSPVDAARRVAQGIEAFGVSNETFLSAQRSLAQGMGLTGLIVVGAEEGGDLVVLEGHVRLTAYMLAPEALTATVQLIVGIAPEIRDWPLY